MIDAAFIHKNELNLLLRKGIISFTIGQDLFASWKFIKDSSKSSITAIGSNTIFKITNNSIGKLILM